MIYTPRASIDMLYVLPQRKNTQVCTKIEYKGFEISIAMDSSHGDGDLRRSDIRVYGCAGNSHGLDVTEDFYIDDENMLVGTGEVLKRVMDQIDKVSL
jgi:hypothetical protein